MESNLKIEEYKDLLASMDNLTSQMPEIIFSNYYETNKYLFALYVESFNSIRGFCTLLANGFLVGQSCALLRMAIESISDIRILEKYPELLEEYVEHWKFRFQIKEEKKQRDKIIEHYSYKIDLQRNKALDYLYYGWIESKSQDYGFHSLIRLAGFDEEPDNILPWVDYLNMWIHGTVSSVNILHGDASIIYSHTLIDIAAKLLDILCCEFHNNTKFNFIINGFDYFKAFRNAYIKTGIDKN